MGIAEWVLAILLAVAMIGAALGFAVVRGFHKRDKQ
jgi:hypothetical protein